MILCLVILKFSASLEHILLIDNDVSNLKNPSFEFDPEIEKGYPAKGRHFPKRPKFLFLNVNLSPNFAWEWKLRHPG